MRILFLVVFYCFLAVSVRTSEVLEVSGHVGGEVSIHCSVGGTKDDNNNNNNNNTEPNNMYFCKGGCSRENIVVEMTEKKRADASREGKYSMEVNKGYGLFNVTIKKLMRIDAGRYCCGVEKTFNVLHQEIDLLVLDAPTVPPGSLPHGSFQSTTKSSRAAAPRPTTDKTNKRTTSNLTDTTMVIIISVSLALLVCALIPLVFYGHWRSNSVQSRSEANKGKVDYCEENAEGSTSTVGMVKLQSLEQDPESSAQDPTQYAAVYQALDPKTLD